MIVEHRYGHGHVIPRPDGVKVRCGGPAMCPVCAGELARKPERNNKLISPIHCDHFGTREFISTYRGSPSGDSYHVDVCTRCGQFRVYARQGKEYMEVQFELLSDESIAATGKYRQYVDSVSASE